MRPEPAKVLAVIKRAIKRDKPIPEGWHEPLLEIVELLLDHRDITIRMAAVAAVIEMKSADFRQASRECRARRATAKLRS